MSKHKHRKMPDETKVEAPSVHGLPDPYANVVTQLDFRLNVDVLKDDILTIKSVSPGRGTIQFLVAAYVKSIADELRERDLNAYTAENLAEFVRIVARRNEWRSVYSGPAGKKPGGNVTGGKKSVRAGVTNPAK